jgi:hypothetical protein
LVGAWLYLNAYNVLRVRFNDEVALEQAKAASDGKSKRWRQRKERRKVGDERFAKG